MLVFPRLIKKFEGDSFQIAASAIVNIIKRYSFSCEFINIHSTSFKRYYFSVQISASLTLSATYIHRCLPDRNVCNDMASYGLHFVQTAYIRCNKLSDIALRVIFLLANLTFLLPAAKVSNICQTEHRIFTFLNGTHNQVILLNQQQ